MPDGIFPLRGPSHGKNGRMRWVSIFLSFLFVWLVAAMVCALIGLVFALIFSIESMPVPLQIFFWAILPPVVSIIYNITKFKKRS